MELSEVVASACNLAYVVLIARGRGLGWPIGLLGAAVSVFVLAGARLYLDAALYGSYALLCVYGWWAWVASRGTESETFRVERSGSQRLFGLLCLAAVASGALGYSAATCADADLPYWDAATSCFSLLGTYMQARRLYENWHLWLVVNSVYVGLYGVKELYFFAGLSVIYLGLSMYGLVKWKRVSELAPT